MNITVIIVELQTGLFDVLRSTFPWTKWVVDDPCVYFQFLFLLSLYERFVSKFSKQDIYQIGKSMKEKYICIFEKRKFQFYLCIQKIRNISFYIVFFPPKIRNRKSTKFSSEEQMFRSIRKLFLVCQLITGKNKKRQSQFTIRNLERDPNRFDRPSNFSFIKICINKCPSNRASVFVSETKDFQFVDTNICPLKIQRINYLTDYYSNIRSISFEQGEIEIIGTKNKWMIKIEITNDSIFFFISLL